MQVLRNIIYLFGCLVFVQSLQAQRTDTSKKDLPPSKIYRSSLGFKVGYDRSYLKDINFSPLNYKGNGNVVDFNFVRDTKRDNIFFTQLDITSTALIPNAPLPPDVNLESERTLINLEMGFLKQLKLKNEKFNLHIGGAYHSYVDILFYKGGESITYFAIHGLDLSTQLTYTPHPKHQIKGSLSIPIIALLVRPPYTGWNKFVDESGVGEILTTGKWTSLNGFSGTNFCLNYTYNLARRWDIEAQYRLRFYSTKHLKQTKIATSQTSLGINFKF